MKTRMTRRELLRYLGLGSMGLALAACQPQVVQETVVVKEEVEKVITATPAPKGPVKLLVIPGINPDCDTQGFWTSVKDLYEETYSDRKIEMNIQPTWDTVWSSVQGAIAAGEPPDVWMTQENGPGIFWENGATLALEDFIDIDPRWSDDTWCASVGMQITDEYTYNQHLVAVPIYTAPLCWMWLKDEFAKIGLESYPTTMDEVVEYGLKFKDAGLEYPFFIRRPTGWGGHWLMWSFGAPGVTDAAGEQQVVDTPEFLASVEWYWNLVHVHKIVNPSYLIQEPDIQLEAVNGNIVLWPQGSWGVSGIMRNPDLADRVSIAPRAAGPAGAIQNVGGSALMVSAKTKYPRESWDFCMVANDADNLANRWVIACFDTVSNCQALRRPQVAEQAPIMFEFLDVMEAEGRVVWTVPWYWDVGTIAQTMVNKMIEADSWAAAQSLVPQFAQEAQKAADEGVAKFGKKE